MPHLRHDPHTDCLLDALARPWVPPANDWRLPHEDPLAPGRSVAYGVLFWSALALALVAWGLWR